ncbi:MAG: formate dehydrogenase accessory sulfurtransferase FdhD [Anaerolineales bacterium]|nr:formate dehydrogenase accessory sulfurtransferase FdhD [Anaerolineales bacterium]
MAKGAVATQWHEFRNNWSKIEAAVIEEAIITIYVNGTELATIMATPKDQTNLAMGFLKNEGLISEMQEIENIYVTHTGCCIDVWLNHSITKPDRVIITSGCGGGITFQDPSHELEPLSTDCYISPEELFHRFQELHQPGSLHAEVRGVHTAGLTDGSSILAVAEDVGRHNTIDKLLGYCLKEGIATEGRILLTTGRMSSEMLRKGALMGCPIIASRNSPTSMSVEMALAWNITLVGYVRRSTLRVYANPGRLQNSSVV